MMSLPHRYKIEKKIYHDSRYRLFRGHRQKSPTNVLIKTLNPNVCKLDASNWLNNEYRILNNLNIQEVIRPLWLGNHHDQLVLVLENFEGQNLTQCMIGQRLEVSIFLEIALKLAKILKKIYYCRIIHQNIQPDSIFFNSQTKEVRLTNFFVATKNIPQSKTSFQEIEASDVAYISPERTGRMDLSVDYRTDFYSLGVVFYQMLTGQLPFSGSNSLEIIHGHLAQTPIPPHKLEPKIPEAISQVVTKLLAKNPDKRYQSAHSIEEDLQICKDQLQHQGEISMFPLAGLEEQSRFKISTKLYGRNSELNKLNQVWRRVNAGNKGLILIQGPAGLGKTTLIHNWISSINSPDSFCVLGKCEQAQNNLPHGLIIQALGNLLQQLLTLSPQELKVWREKLLFAVGHNGKVITDILPEFKLLIDSSHELTELPPTASQNRFQTVFSRFIQVFAQQDQPLIIVMDDLQWADPASLKLIGFLLDNYSLQNLLIIANYRDEELTDEHPLSVTLATIKNSAAIHTIRLNPLNAEETHQLVIDTLACKPKESLSLARILFRLSRGHPLFLHQLLQKLYKEKLFAFDFDQLEWTWNTAAIQSKGINSYDLLNLLLSNLHELPHSSLQILKLASCIGLEFDFSLVRAANPRKDSDIEQILSQAEQEGLILRIVEGTEVKYRFTHSRIQETLYELISETNLPTMHLQIARYLWKQASPENLEEQIFTLVHHGNLARNLITNPAECFQLAELNLVAAKQAKELIAYELAVEYLEIALEVIPSNAWQANYSTMLAIHWEMAELQYLLANFTKATEFCDMIFDRVETALEKVKVYQIKIHGYIAQNQMAVAVSSGLEVLELLEISLTKKQDYLPELGKLAQNVATNVESFQQLPEMNDPAQKAAMEILVTIIPPAYIVRPELVPSIASTMMRICRVHGNSELSPYAYAVYAILLCTSGYVDAGYQLGLLSLDLQSQTDVPIMKSKVDFIFNNMIRHWKEPGVSTLDYFLRGVQSGIETGDVEHACFHAQFYCSNIMLVGEPLTSAAEKSAPQIEIIQNFQQNFQLNFAQMWLQFNLNLQGLTREPLLLIGTEFNELEILPMWQEANNAASLFAFYLIKSILYYLLGNFQESLAYAQAGKNYLNAASGSLSYSSFFFYYSLALVANYSTWEPIHKPQFWEELKSCQHQIKDWSTHAPENYLHRYELLTAEIARVSGQYQEAAEHYDQAITLATKSEYIHEAALASELAGIFYLSRERIKIAQLYLSDACKGYEEWGAKAKVEQLNALHQELLLDSSIRQTNSQSDKHLYYEQEQFWEQSEHCDISALINQTDSPATLDLYSVVKASQAISEEIILDNLLAKMMNIVMENAGAQKSSLFLVRNASLILAAQAAIAPEKKIELPFTPLEQHSDLPVSLINYVYSTRRTMILEGSNQDSIFANDNYFKKYQPQSVLCLPMNYKNDLQGIVYLENSFVKGAFTPQKLDILQVILSQVSISIENARLYKNLQDHASVRKSLHQKEVLLKEIHHRVKNNLLVVSSLLDFQSSYTDSPEILKLLENCQNRITSMALVHQHLYGNSELDKIEFSEYVKSLMDNLAYSQGCLEKGIELNLDLDAVELNIETANPCGLIINELISNALEHAFTDCNQGNIWLKLKHKDSDQIILTIQDDGVGFAGDQNLYNHDSLGLELVCTLVEQIDGQISLDSTDGTKIEIMFKELEYQKRF